MLRTPLAMLAPLTAWIMGCAGPAHLPAHARSPAPASKPAFELVESTPVETALDHRDVPDAAAVWVAMVREARASIDLAQFYASNHLPGALEPVIAALEAAIARGVRVRFLAERGFVQNYPDTLERLARAGAVVRQIDLRATPGGGGILHAKYFVVDDREAFLGSQNFDWRALEHNFELGLRIRDAGVVGGLAAIFAADWARAGGEPIAPRPAPPSSPGITLVASPPELLPAGVAWDLPRLAALIDGATSSIRIQLLSYRADADGAAWDALDAPLRRAAARGVRVELMLADWSKRPRTLPGLQRLARVPRIAIRLTTIPPWSGGFIPFARVSHAKTLVVDGARAWLGTSNWERDYFTRSRNVGVVLDDPAIAAAIDRAFLTLWSSPYAAALDPDAAYTPPRIE